MAKKVCVLGELNVDLIATAETIVPEWNKEKLVDSFDMVLGSSSAITACGLAGLGLEVEFVGVVGDDTFGRFCIEELQKRKVGTSSITVKPDLKTGVTLSLSTHKDRALLTYMGAIPELKRENVPSDLLNQVDHLHFGSYYLQKGMQAEWQTLFKEVKDQGITTSFDTGWDPDENWQKDQLQELLVHTDLFIPSEEELYQITSVNSLEEGLQEMNQTQGNIAVKQGSKGALFQDKHGIITKSKAFPVVPIDTTGAGDSFNAGLIYSFLNGEKVERCLVFANACGALATQRIGGASYLPSVEEVECFIAENKR